MIYYAEINDYWIKIGMTMVWERRRKTLEKHYKGQRSLKLLGVHAGGRWTEQCFHGKFRHLRHNKTELFHPADDLLRHIKAHTVPWEPRHDTDTKWDRELKVCWYGDGLRCMEELSERNGTTLSRTINEAVYAFANSIGYSDPEFTLGDREPHHLFGYQPPTYEPPTEDEETEASSSDEADAESRDAEEAAVAERPAFVMQGGWG